MRHITWKSVRTLDADRMLGAVGLQKRRDPITDVLVPAVTLFAAGAFVGAATAMLFTPKSGPMFRRQLADGAKGFTRKLGDGRQRASSDEPQSLQSAQH